MTTAIFAILPFISSNSSWVILAPLICTVLDTTDHH
jgi:hypothetical protein